MSEQPPTPPNDRSPSAPEPVTVVGYPGLPPVPGAQVVPGLASVRMATATARAMAIAALVLVVVVIAAVALGFVMLRGQISTLSTQVTSLQEQQAQALEQPASAPSVQGGQEAPTADGDGAASGSVVPQLPAAPTLPSGVRVPGGVDQAGAVLVGDPDASNVVEVYLDYQCPYCQRWEADLGRVLTERALQPDSDLLVKHYVLAFLGETSPNLDPPGASARAASAALCVAEGEGPAAFAEFSEQVYASADPSESASLFGIDVMADIARQIGSADATIECIEQERHVAFVALGTQAGFARGVQGTPTVTFNGRTVENAFADPELLSLLS